MRFESLPPKPVPAFILIVEDHDDSRTLLKIHLQIAGYVVVAATCCDEALTYAQGAHFDLCILDHFLRDGTGLDLRQKLRGYQPDMPAVYCTGAAYSGSQVERLRQTGDEYLLKPVEPQILKEIVARLLTAS